MAGEVAFKPASQTPTIQTNAADTPADRTTPHTVSDTIEVPFSAYKEEHHRPLSADYFELGDSWREFEEVSVIEDYFKSQVEGGSLQNSIEAVRAKIKQFEKMVNIDKTERQVVKVAKIAAYVKFLKEVDNVERNNSKYGNI